MEIDESDILTAEKLLAKELQNAVEEFGIAIGKNKEKIFELCADLFTQYGFEDADEFAEAYLAFASSENVDELNENVLKKFEKQELATRGESVTKSSIISSSKTLAFLSEPASSLGNNDFKIYGGQQQQQMVVDLDSDNEENADGDLKALYGLETGTCDTPKVQKKSKAHLRSNLENTPTCTPMGYSPAIGSKSVSYASRSKAGDTVLHYKCKDSSYWNEVPGNNEALKVIPSTATKRFLNLHAFKYMIQNTSNMASALNSFIEETGYDMFKEDDKEILDLRSSSGEDGWFLGRIRNTDDSKISQSSVYLEGDIGTSGGHIVELDMSTVEEYRLFPGLVAVVKGRNELGKIIRVSQILTPPMPPIPSILPGTTRPLNVIIACGPYTPADSMLYEPLSDLIQAIQRDKPDVCILLGPFIDPNHPKIADGEIADTFEDLFQKIAKKQIMESIKDLNTHVVFISSFKDAHHHMVYPTPPYARECMTPTKATPFSSFPDPAVFDVGGITFGVTSTDILKHLANTELGKSTIMDRMGGLSKCIISQRNLYPLYPPDESVPFDIQLWKKHCLFEQAPHVLIIPSDLRYFIKDIDGTIVVNPERLTKGKAGGTYARLQIKLPDVIDNDTTSISDFCCGEIVKI